MIGDSLGGAIVDATKQSIADEHNRKIASEQTSQIVAGVAAAITAANGTASPEQIATAVQSAQAAASSTPIGRLGLGGLPPREPTGPVKAADVDALLANNPPEPELSERDKKKNLKKLLH